MLTDLFNIGREYIVASYIKSFIKDYADIVDVNIDSEKRLMEFKIRLHGEDEITIATVIGYDIYKDAENTYFRYDDFVTTKPWVNKIIENFSNILVKDNQFIIPNALLKTFLPILLK